MMDALTVISSASAPVGTAAVAMRAPTMIRTLCQVLRRMSQLLRRGCGNPRRGVHRSLSKIGILFSGKGGRAHHDSSRKCRWAHHLKSASTIVCVFGSTKTTAGEPSGRLAFINQPLQVCRTLLVNE